MNIPCPKQTAINFTALGIEGIIRHCERQLAQLDEFDALYGERGQEARDNSRPFIKARLEAAQEALRLRKRRDRSDALNDEFDAFGTL